MCMGQSGRDRLGTKAPHHTRRTIRIEFNLLQGPPRGNLISFSKCLTSVCVCSNSMRRRIGLPRAGWAYHLAPAAGGGRELRHWTDFSSDRKSGAPAATKVATQWQISIHGLKQSQQQQQQQIVAIASNMVAGPNLVV